jgi:Dynamin family/Dynamin central region/Dynamin GTPase effector domain
METISTISSLPIAAGQANLIDVVDQLRNQGLSDVISLPQLIACGDQSSGKSSVLESISGIRFPINEGLCTRFATEVKLRRSQEEFAQVRIIPGDATSAEEVQRLKGFRKDGVKLTDVPALIKDATEAMGLTGNKTLSNHTLQLEVSGPNQPHLTLVDLPGLIHASHNTHDVSLIRSLVKAKMKEKRSIILIVVSAQNDTSLQVVTEIAREVDPSGARMLGIITKPDTLYPGSPKAADILSYARNEEYKLQFGWHVVRNADFEQRNDPTYDFKAREAEFFAGEPWTSLPPSQLGGPALAHRLSKRLFEQICLELPSLITEIDLKVNNCVSSLLRLGESRASFKEKRKYLGTIADKFCRLLENGVAGRYENEKFFDHNNAHFRAEIRTVNDNFANDMYQYGRTYKILNANGQPILHTTHQEGGGSASSKHRHSYQLPQIISESDFLDMVQSQILQPNRGRQLPPLSDPCLVGPVFRLQCRDWQTIAIDHVQAVFEVTKNFTMAILEHVAEPVTGDRLSQKLIEPALRRKHQELLEKVKELLEPYQTDFPYSVHPLLTEELFKIDAVPGPAKPTEWHDQSTADRLACTKLMQYAQTYYNFAQYVFVDNVIILGVENCLLKRLTDLLTPLQVLDLDDNQVEELAEESDETVATRTMLERRLEVLQQALTICNAYKLRDLTTTLPKLTEPEKPHNPETPRSSQGRENLDPAKTNVPVTDIITPPESDSTSKIGIPEQAIFQRDSRPVQTTPAPSPFRTEAPSTPAAHDTPASVERKMMAHGAHSPASTSTLIADSATNTPSKAFVEQSRSHWAEKQNKTEDSSSTSDISVPIGSNLQSDTSLAQNTRSRTPRRSPAPSTGEPSAVKYPAFKASTPKPVPAFGLAAKDVSSEAAASGDSGAFGFGGESLLFR